MSSIAQAETEVALIVAGDAAAVERLFAMFDRFPLMFDMVGQLTPAIGHSFAAAGTVHSIISGIPMVICAAGQEELIGPTV